jgi:hypothetical protein
VWRRRPEPVLTVEELNGFIAILMRIDANIAWIRAVIEEDDGEEDTAGS